MSDLTSARARALLAYDPATGRFTWRVRRGGTAVAGSPAGRLNSEGYAMIRVDGRRYLAHRLAWLIMTGEWPATEVDHRDTDPGNNAWTNLRLATRSQNMQNRRAAGRNSATGVLGVSPCRSRYRAVIKTSGRIRHLGVFATVEAAEAAYLAAKVELHPFAGR